MRHCVSSRAATILYHCGPVSEAMWGRLATCGRLAIGQMPLVTRNSQAEGPPLRLAAMPGRLLTCGGLGAPFGPRPVASVPGYSGHGDAACSRKRTGDKIAGVTGNKESA